MLLLQATYIIIIHGFLFIFSLKGGGMDYNVADSIRLVKAN